MNADPLADPSRFPRTASRKKNSFVYENLILGELQSRLKNILGFSDYYDSQCVTLCALC